MVFSRQMLATMLRRSGVLQSRVLGSVITQGLVCLTSFVATLAGGASDFFPGSCWLQGSVSQVFAVASFGFYRVVLLFTQCGDSHSVGHRFSKGFPSTEFDRLRKRITVAIFNVGETPCRRANLRVFHNRLKNKKINTIIILIIIEIKNTLIN